jgi:hypothetical protein
MRVRRWRLLAKPTVRYLLMDEDGRRDRLAHPHPYPSPCQGEGSITLSPVGRGQGEGQSHEFSDTLPDSERTRKGNSEHGRRRTSQAA